MEEEVQTNLARDGHVHTERDKCPRKWQTDLGKEEGKQSSNPRRESERVGCGGEVEGALPVGVPRSQ